MKLVLLKTDQDFAPNRFKRSVSSSLLRIRTALRNQNIPRFGFIVPKKVLPNSVDRNKIRRRLKAILNKNYSAIKPFDILFFPQKNSLNKTYKELEEDLIQNLKKINAWKL